MKNKPVFFTTLFTLTILISLPALTMQNKMQDKIQDKKHTKRTQKKLEKREIIGKIIIASENPGLLVKPNDNEPLSPKSLSKKQEKALVSNVSKKRHSKSDDMGELDEMKKEIEAKNKKNSAKEALVLKKTLEREALEEIYSHNREDSIEFSEKSQDSDEFPAQELETERPDPESGQEAIPTEEPATEQLETEEAGSESGQDN